MFISENNLAALLGTSVTTVKGWVKRGVYPIICDSQGIRGFDMESLRGVPEIDSMLGNNWEKELHVKPLRDFTSVELFAGAGGLALGIEKAGFHHILLNEFDTSACDTLRVNRPQWTVVEGDVRHIDFTPLRDKVDLLTGGFPCQAFSFAGKQGGFNDVRGTLFFELARAVKEIQPKVFMAENVKGLASHDSGKTFRTICNVISELGYTLVEPRVLKAIMYQVPQKRERIILVAIRNDIAPLVDFHWPSPFERVLNLKDALYKSEIYDCDVPESEGVVYPQKKKEILTLVPQGGDWRDLDEETAKSYLGGSWELGGGKTGMARRLSLNEPSLTLTCSPAQKQTERCHPIETRPLTVREYARIQTFPDNWLFQGTLSSKYKQIGNAVPVNLAWAVGRSLMRLFNEIQKINPVKTPSYQEGIKEIIKKQSQLITIKDNKNQISTVKERCSQLSLTALFEEFGDCPVYENLVASDSLGCYQVLTDMILDKELIEKNVLIGYVKREKSRKFKDGEADIYFTGKRFPATIPLKSLYFFMPYIKGEGIRDLYLIKKIYVDKYKEDKENKSDYRLAFQIEYMGQLFPEYKSMNLDVWYTFSQKTIRELLDKKIWKND